MFAFDIRLYFAYMIKGRFTQCAAILCLSSVLSACGGSKHAGRSGPVVPGTWQATPIVINGDCTDWPSPYPNYDAKSKVAYATSNDDEFLYVTMQTGDPLTQIKVLKQGLTVSIDTGGHKDPSFHINFPLPNEDDLSALFSHDEGSKKDATPQLSRQFVQKLRKSAEDCHQFSLEGFSGCNGAYMVSQQLPCGVTVKLAIDEYQQLVWEAAIPFKALWGYDNAGASHKGKPLSVCYSVKGFKDNTKKTNTSSAPMNSGGMGGPGGMGAGGRMNSRPMMGPSTTSSGGGPMQHLYESTKTWKHFTIAWK